MIKQLFTTITFAAPLMVGTVLFAACATPPKTSVTPPAPPVVVATVAPAPPKNWCQEACDHIAHTFSCSEGNEAACVSAYETIEKAPIQGIGGPGFCRQIAEAANVSSVCDIGIKCTEPNPAGLLMQPQRCTWVDVCGNRCVD
jgi:hypothetical protein